MLLVAATVALAAVAGYQISSARSENRITQTLLACGQYDTSPVLYHCIRRIGLAEADGSLEKDPMRYRREMMTVLNFLDSIAIGIDQDLYVERVAFDHIEAIVRTHVFDLIDSGIVDRATCRRDSWHRLIDRRDKWVRAAPTFRG